MTKRFLCCNNCGYRIGTSTTGSQTEISCPKCGTKFEFEIVDDTVMVIRSKETPKKPKKTG